MHGRISEHYPRSTPIACPRHGRRLTNIVEIGMGRRGEVGYLACPRAISPGLAYGLASEPVSKNNFDIIPSFQLTIEIIVRKISDSFTILRSQITPCLLSIWQSEDDSTTKRKTPGSAAVLLLQICAPGRHHSQYATTLVDG